MSSKIIHFPNSTESESAYEQRMKQEALMAHTRRAFAKRVDRNLVNIDAQWYEYIAKIAEWIYLSVWAGADVCSNVDYILRVEYQVKSCNIFECKQLLILLDHYLSTPTIATSWEKWFMTHVRNKVFEQQEKLREEMKNKTP